MRKFTEAEQKVLADALTTGHAYARGGRGLRDLNQGHSTKVLRHLWAEAYLDYVPYRINGNQISPSFYSLTELGREAALTLSDKESSASRQHYIDTGRYLKYSAREDLNPSRFNVGDVVVNKHHVRDSVVWKVVGKRYAADGVWMYDVRAAEPCALNGVLKGVTLTDYVEKPPAPPAEPRRITTRDEFRELAKELGVGPIWHEPDEVDVSAKVRGKMLDNSGTWARPDTEGVEYEELHVYFLKEGRRVAVANLASICAWAAETD